MHKTTNSQTPSVEAIGTPLSASGGRQVAKAVKQVSKQIVKGEQRTTTVGKQTIHILLIDTHALMLIALQRVVAAFPRVKIVGHLQTLCEVQTLLERMEVDVVVFGISISVTECLQFTNYINEKCRNAGIVVIQPHLRPETAHALVKQGVHGLLDEFASEQDLADAIATVAMGCTFLSKHARDILAASMSRAALYLTVRELEVAALLLRGESNFRIAHALGLKEKTVEAHLTNIYSKLEVTSRAEAILGLQALRV